jgi:hypothetical protein
LCRRRRILWRLEAGDLLRRFARECAADVLHLWDAPQVVKDYLKGGDESLRAAARDAAWAATWAAAWDAATAARDAARTRDAASAAWHTARADAAREAARDAAWDAAWDAQNTRLETLFWSQNDQAQVKRQ